MKINRILAAMTLLVFLSQLTHVSAQQICGGQNYPPIGKLVDVGGYKLHINSSGKRSPTVVLIAGSGDFSFDWSLVQPAVSEFARVSSYDRAGLAWSDLGPTPRTIRQDAYELHLILKKARLKAPYILVGHSIGGLIARVYAEQYPQEVVGMVLVDSTTEDTTLSYQGKLVRVIDTARDRPIPSVQTMASSPPKPPTADDLKQAEFNKQLFGAPKINAPFDKLPLQVQKMRLWALNSQKLFARSDDYFAEELKAISVARSQKPDTLGDIPLVVLIAGKNENPGGVSVEEWKRLTEEKRQQKTELVSLSRNSKLIFAEKSGHHIQLEEPDLVVSAVRQVVESVRTRSKLAR